MTPEILPDIPRTFTALAEWSACLVYILLMRKRMPRVPLIVAITLGMAGLLGIQVLASMMPLELWVVGMAMAVAGMYGFILLCADISPREAGDLVARAFVLAELVASLEWQLHVFFFRGQPESTWLIVLLVAVYVSAFPFAWWLERRHFPRDHQVPVDNRALVTAAAVAIVTFMMSNLSFVTSNTPFSGPIGPEVFYIRTLVDLCGFVVLFALRGQRLELQRGAEVEAVSMMLNHQQERYLQSKHDIDAVNSKYHDLKHYIHAIRAEADPETKAGFVDQLEDSIRGYETSALETGSPVLDTILTSKIRQAERSSVTLTCVADGAAVAFMDPMDLVTIVGNAVDNAIEATAPLPRPEQRLVRLAIYRQGEFAMLRFENFFEGTVELVNGLPRTTKARTLHHGYGLKNMRETAERYGGSLTARAEDDWFVVRTLIPIPDTSAQPSRGSQSAPGSQP
jgi:signal transduction histidine kinase